MKKLFGLILIISLLAVAFLLLKDCNAEGGGNSPLAKSFQNPPISKRSS